MGQDHGKLYDLLKSNNFNSKKIVDELSKNFDAISVLAKHSTKDEFIGALNGESPAIKLTPTQMELIKGGKPLAALIEQVLSWFYTPEK